MSHTHASQGGVSLTKTGADFTVWSHHAERIELCLFDTANGNELCRLPMERAEGDLHRLHVEGTREGAHYGYRAHGRYKPDQGFWYDPSKLLVDPYAKELDRPFVHDPRLSTFGEETADLVPKAVVTRDRPAKVLMPFLPPGGFIYEVAVRPFTKLHPDIPETLRGTVGALAHPAVLGHLKKLGVDAVELMPITARIDERHLPPLGLANSWGYNPVALMALDPRLVPGGVAELRATVDALHAEGIGVILDLVFNHTGESDRYGTTLSLRGLDNLAAYRHVDGHPGKLVNDTGCGNTLACDHTYVRRLITDSLRHFVLNAGVDGFRFDLAPILGRTAHGFHTTSQTLHAITADDVLEDRVLIAEPWDIGPGGYQLGNFPKPFLEWNDRARDNLRRYWRGDSHMTGALATALAGSSDIFARNGERQTRTVNFIAAHDGFTLFDLVSHTHKHNDRNGENNRDGHDENYSWNNGAEGETPDKAIARNRKRDVAALLSTLFATRGAIMLTAGDEGGRTQHGNNNAYCQDNELTWLDWKSMDGDLVDLTAALSSLRKRFAVFAETRFFTGENGDVTWISSTGAPMTVSEWEAAEGPAIAMVLTTKDLKRGGMVRLAVLFNRSQEASDFELPAAASLKWRRIASGKSAGAIRLKPRSVEFLVEH
ncbi:glycogen debranching protein GlgX [Rhizobium sp. CG5]|uniref:glycogen debranching protein GlgX n=1 Tax=Rhizobium sp. CG5 TaxID=2726076 RepID=UPI0020347EE2|nr:glycogen debranching protein GlgX [Rhizobium sp. CG5]MCM2475908.1 glycogen debranching protein GlgX [Rhizobium sp. CG5]